MGKIFATISVSLDGYVAGPNQTLDEPLGKGGENLHEWVVKLASWRKEHGMTGGESGPDDEIVKETTANVGAYIMGRKMYSGGSGAWEADNNSDGWWGDEPPFHVPVFILTHHERETVTKEGGTTFTFVTDGVDSAVAQARAAAGDKDISVSGGAETIQQCIKAGYVEELEIHVVPILLGGGARLFENMGGVTLEKIRVIDSPLVTHMKFRCVYA